MPENLPPSLVPIKASAEKFVDEVLKPLDTAYREDRISLEDARADVRHASKSAGFFVKTQPAEFGGDPAATLELTMLREMFAACNTVLSHAIFGPGPGVLHSVEGVLKTDYLKPLMNGEKSGAFAFTEPDTAERPTWAVVNDKELVVNGRKSYVTGGASADFISTLLNIEYADGSKAGTAMVVIDRDADGVILEKEFESMDGSGHVSIRFDHTRVPKDRIIGKVGEGMPRALANIGNVRMMVAAQAVGICMWVIEYIEKHLQSPHRSGTPLGAREGVRLRLADMRIETFVARSALYRTARIVDSGENSVNETIATKVFCTETAGRVVDQGVQLVGGQGLVRGHPLEKLYREVRSYRFIEGASDLLRLNLAKGSLELGKGKL